MLWDVLWDVILSIFDVRISNRDLLVSTLREHWIAQN